MDDVAAREIGGYRFTLREFGDGVRLPRHAHPDAFATIVVEGRLFEDDRECGTHDVIVHAPGESHANRFAGRRTRCLRVQGVSFERTTLLSSPQVSSVAAKLVREFRRPDALSPIAIEAIVLELFVLSERQRGESAIPAWLTSTHASIADRFQEPLTIGALAEAAGVHPGHLARAFHQHYGVTVGERIRELRVDYARQRLASNDALHRIALDAGFADQSHFTRTFRRATGMTPLQYRHALRR